MLHRARPAHGTGGRAWIDYMLTELLGWDDALVGSGLDEPNMHRAEHDTTGTSSFALLEPGADFKPDAVLPGRLRVAGAEPAVLNLAEDAPCSERFT